MLKLDLKFPQSWEELSDRQLVYIFRLMSVPLPLDTVKIYALFRWNGLSVVARNGKGSFLLKRKGDKNLFEISPIQLAELMPSMSWLDIIPDKPVKVSRFCLRKGLAIDFIGVPFEKFVMADNLYQGYLSTQDEDLLCQLGYILYGTGSLSQWQRVACFYWFASLKNYLSVKFPDFLRSARGGSDRQPDPVEAMNAQIRALTKGDITKEKTVLSLDTWRALAELNAQAAEYIELNKKLKK